MKKIPSFVYRTKLFQFLREQRRRELFASLKQIHAEVYFFSHIWKFIQSFPEPTRVTWYVLTPANYSLLKVCYAVPSKTKLAQIMSAKLAWMKEHNYPIGLHVHFYRISSMPKDRKKQIITEAISYGEENEVLFKKLVPGWFNYTADLNELCNEFGIELVGEEPYLHDYDLSNYQQFFRGVKPF